MVEAVLHCHTHARHPGGGRPGRGRPSPGGSGSEAMRVNRAPWAPPLMPTMGGLLARSGVICCPLRSGSPWKEMLSCTSEARDTLSTRSGMILQVRARGQEGLGRAAGAALARGPLQQPANGLTCCQQPLQMPGDWKCARGRAPRGRRVAWGPQPGLAWWQAGATQTSQLHAWGLWVLADEEF